MDELLGIVGTLIGVLVGAFVGSYLTYFVEKRLLRISDIRRQLEKAYSPLYSILSRKENLRRIKDSDEFVVEISPEEKRQLDEIMTAYSYMFPKKIDVYWRENIRDLLLKGYVLEGSAEKYPIPVFFEDEIIEEFKHRMVKYYKEMGRGEELKNVPDWAQA